MGFKKGYVFARRAYVMRKIKIRHSKIRGPKRAVEASEMTGDPIVYFQPEKASGCSWAEQVIMDVPLSLACIS